MNNILKGEIYYADLSGSIGSEQGETRPVLIVQNDIGNKYSPTTIIVCLTSLYNNKKKIPTHYIVRKGDNGLKVDSLVLCEQIRTIDKHRLTERVGALSEEDLKEVEKCLRTSIGI